MNELDEKAKDAIKQITIAYEHFDMLLSGLPPNDFARIAKTRAREALIWAKEVIEQDYKFRHRFKR